MRTVYVQELMRLPLGKQGENGAARIVWQGLAARYQALYGSGAFTLTAKRCGDAAAYPVAVSTEGGDVVWLVRAADVASPGSGSCELTYTVDGAVAKSQTWSTYVAASISGDAPGEPPEEPAKAWFAAIQAQIGNLDDLTTKARASLVTAVNEAARTGSGGAGSISMRTADGYIQYSTDGGANWENLIALAELKGAPGQDGAPGKDGEPGKDGHTPKIAATKTGKTTSITADGLEIAQIKDGEDAAADLSLGITGATVGQIAKIAAVDSGGKPTAWGAADMAGGETWELIASGEMQETAALNINKDNNGLPFALKSAQILVRGDISVTKASSIRVLAERFVSGGDYDSYSIEVFFGKDNPKVNLWYVLCEKTMPMLFWEVADLDWKSADCQVLMGVHRYHSATEDVYGKDPLNHLINRVSIGPYMGVGNMAAGCKYEIWGVRA